MNTPQPQRELLTLQAILNRASIGYHVLNYVPSAAIFTEQAAVLVAAGATQLTMTEFIYGHGWITLYAADERARDDT